MYELKKNEKVLTSKFVGTGPSSYEKRIYRAAVSQRLRNTDLHITALPPSLPPSLQLTVTPKVVTAINVDTLNSFKICSG